MAPDVTQLALECCETLIEASRQRDLLDLLDTFPPDLRQRERVRVMEARAALDIGDLRKVRGILRTVVDMPDIREGEVSLTDLWFRMHEKRLANAENVLIDTALRERVRRDFPPPPALDFRMSANGPKPAAV